MSYVRRNVVDGVTIFNKALYDNVQDGVDELFIKSDKNKQDIESSNNEIAVLQEGVADCNNQIKTVENIAKGKNRARVFSTTEKMAEWLSNEDNKSLCNVGDNLYIVDVGVPDWWISKVLSERNPETGYFYEIAQLETQKVDLSTIEAEIADLREDVEKGSIIEVTQEEYDALPDTKLTDGKLYKIKDVDIVGDASTVKYIKSGGVVTDVASELGELTNSLSNLPTATLSAGSTSVTITDARIKADGLIDIYTDVYGVNPTAIEVSDSNVTLTFDAQESDVIVKVRCL